MGDSDPPLDHPCNANFHHFTPRKTDMLHVLLAILVAMAKQVTLDFANATLTLCTCRQWNMSLDVQLKSELCICSAARRHEAAQYVLRQKSCTVVAAGKVDAPEIGVNAPCEVHAEELLGQQCSLSGTDCAQARCTASGCDCRSATVIIAPPLYLAGHAVVSHLLGQV